MTSKADTDKAILMAAFAKMDPVALAVAMGTVWALILLVATTVLLIKGAPAGGGQIGGHLELLSIYLPGYRVTWAGGFLGAFYFWLIGAVVGYVLAVLWNLTHYLYIVTIVVRSAWWRMMAD